MSLITVRIYDVLRNLTCGEGVMSWGELIEKSYEKFFDFDLPWYSETGAGLLDFKKMYLHRNLMKEIGQETLELHKQKLYSRIYENMETYKQLYGVVLKNGVMVNNTSVTYEEVLNSLNSGDETQTRQYKGKSENVTNQESIHSDNPQVTYSENDYASTMDRGEQTTEENASSTDTLKVDRNDDKNESRTWHKEGYENVDLQKAVTAIKDGTYNINLTILKDCDNLFLGVW